MEITEVNTRGATHQIGASSILLSNMASSWVQNGPATEFTFTLRSDAEWTDGSPVTADDVRYGILRSLDPVSPSPLAYVLFVIHNAQEYHDGEDVE